MEQLPDPAALDQPRYLTAVIELASEFTRAMNLDPLLPPELLPQPWPGTQARDAIAQCWRQMVRTPAAKPHATPVPPLRRRHPGSHRPRRRLRVRIRVSSPAAGGPRPGRGPGIRAGGCGSAH
ncbi:PaaX family transcriptional regulator C-terminal domain-containing protein [Nocardia gipuzkoensis]